MLATDPSLDALVAPAIERAQRVLGDAAALRSRRERAGRRRVERLLGDPRALGVTVQLTDEVMRFATARAGARALRHAAARSSIAGFGLTNALGLRLGALASRVAPAPVLALVHARVRSLSSDLILDADPVALRAHLARRRAEGLALNVNVLGEAVLGDAEATDRLGRVIEMMARPEVSYVSVKLSSIVSQLVTVDVAGSRERVSDRLALLFRGAQQHEVFVNLDMEEYRDLRLTVDAFTTVLDRNGLAGLSAGIVLQAYLPESHDALEELLEWASARVARGGAPIKVRLVKGANLAMEHAEAELHGWRAAPYATKADVDASYARLLDVALRPRWAGAIRVGVASHNLFHVAWAVEVARARGVADALDVEMLEGMANAEARALARDGLRVVLYTPVTRRDDFASAVAYLVRRLDENTSPENYLTAAFAIDERPSVFADQSARFSDSVARRHDVSVMSLRGPGEPSGAFANVPDGDPTDTKYLEEVCAAMDDQSPEPVSWVGVPGSDAVEGRDPNTGSSSYRYGVADAADVDAAMERATVAGAAWGAIPASGRRDTLERVAALIGAQRAHAVAVMARDAGKTVAEADPEVSEAIDFARYYAMCAESMGTSAPLGVVVVTPPWNFPYAIPAGGVAAALAAGNAVIVKPAPETVATCELLVRQFWEGGVPRDVLQFLPTRDDDVGRRLVTHPGAGAVVLTGSIGTARLFTAWREDLSLLAETSGKNAILVTGCADVDLAVRDLVHSAFSHAGQKCSAASLAIVDAALLTRSTFTRQLRDAVTSLRVGAATDLGTVVGPLIRPPEEDLTRALTTLDVDETWLVEPRRLAGAGELWSPGVKLGVRAGSWSHQHEWFGPVLGVMASPDLATAVAWQNATPFGLTAGLHSLDESECDYWLEHVAAGNLYVNRATTGAVVARQPFGGWKASAVGPTAKAGGPHYVECLRAWPAVEDVDAALTDLRAWFDEVGSRALDASGLVTERNVHRYRRPPAPILVRVDDGRAAQYLAGIADVTGVVIETSSAARGADVTEPVGSLVARAAPGTRVRWLGDERAPAGALLERGVTIDRRPLAQDGAVEGARWLLEQSVTVTNHRYGNVAAGPKPLVPGLTRSGSFVGK